MSPTSAAHTHTNTERSTDIEQPGGHPVSCPQLFERVRLVFLKTQQQLLQHSKQEEKKQEVNKQEENKQLLNTHTQNCSYQYQIIRFTVNTHTPKIVIVE